METPRFYTENGNFLSSYGFACGYVQKQETETQHKEMYQEHGHFHVRAGKKGERVTTWETFDKLQPAKRFYKGIKLHKR